MTEHPITPSSELVGKWLSYDGYPWDPSENATITITTNRLRNVATQAARWGADQELEACCEAISQAWQMDHVYTEEHLLREVRAARRPKPPSLKQQALAQFNACCLDPDGIIRRALESLPD